MSRSRTRSRPPRPGPRSSELLGRPADGGRAARACGSGTTAAGPGTRPAGFALRVMSVLLRSGRRPDAVRPLAAKIPRRGALIRRHASTLLPLREKEGLTVRSRTPRRGFDDLVQHPPRERIACGADEARKAPTSAPIVSGDEVDIDSTRSTRAVERDILFELDRDRLPEAKARIGEEGETIEGVPRARPRFAPPPAGEVVGFEPGVSTVGDRRPTCRSPPKPRGATRRSSTARDGCRLHPVQRPSDGDDVEETDGIRQVLRPTLDQAERHPGPVSRVPCGHEHGRLRIDPDEFADPGRETERQNPGAGAKIQQAFGPAESQPPRHLLEEERSVRWPRPFVISHRGCETSHSRPPRRLNPEMVGSGKLVLDKPRGARRQMIAIDQDTDVLGIIDVQPTFMPGGELAVPEGHAVVAPINHLLTGTFAHAFATQDWHPPGHVSFASTHGATPFGTIALPYGEQTLWPDHGVIGSTNAALHPSLDLSRVEAIFRKGFRSGIDSYSAFRENDRRDRHGPRRLAEGARLPEALPVRPRDRLLRLLVGPGRAFARLRGVRRRGCEPRPSRRRPRAGPHSTPRRALDARRRAFSSSPAPTSAAPRPARPARHRPPRSPVS